MKEDKNKSWISNACIMLIFLMGTGILLYPTVSNLWNKHRNAQLITEYAGKIAELEREQSERMMREAKAYNNHHTVNIISDIFKSEEKGNSSHSYHNLLNPNGDGVMGYVEIPRIDVKLAIYHGVETNQLENGCGHVEGTSLPISGESVHAVLAAHRGLPSAKLFTDLDQMKVGDIFYVTILNERIQYEVDQIKTVLPTEFEDLDIQKGENHITLLTCTPYGINSHRLLVRGYQTECTGVIKEKRLQKKL